MTEPNINILTRNLPFDSDVRHWSYPLMTPLYCLWLNRTIERMVNLNVTWLGSVFVLILFVHMHGIVWGEWGHLKLNIQGQGGGRSWKVGGQGVGSLDNWTIFMDVICISSLILMRLFLCLPCISLGRYYKKMSKVRTSGRNRGEGCRGELSIKVGFKTFCILWFTYPACGLASGGNAIRLD